MNLKEKLFYIRLHASQAGRFLNALAETVILLASLATIFLFVYQFGFDHPVRQAFRLHSYYTILLLVYFGALTLRYLVRFREIRQEKKLAANMVVYFLLVTLLCTTVFFRGSLTAAIPFLKVFTLHPVSYLLLAAICLIQLSRQIFLLIRSYIKPSLLFLVSFVFFIIVGWGLLLLPNATTGHISLTDALFMSTTSVCITGLTTLDVASVFTRTGHTIIMALVQVGGIGVMTFTSFIALSFMQNSSFSVKLMLKDMLNEEKTGGLFRVILNILAVTFFVESIGAYLIYTQIKGTLGGDAGDELFFSVFHSITAFCSAGISTVSGGYSHPVLSSRYNLHMIISLLIVLGGLGFPIVFNYLKLARYSLSNRINVWIGLQKHPVHIPRIINLHTYIVVLSTLVLITVGFISFFLLEYNNSLDGLPLGGKLAESFLGAVTPRTAGITVIDTSVLSSSTLVMTIALMIIGAAPMSTGGGMKVTTVFIAVMAMISIIREKENVEVNRREIAPQTLRKALGTIILYFLILLVVISALTVTENGIPLFNLLFESVSALSTVGLSMGITPHLTDGGKLILCVTMLIGRIGLLTFFASFWDESKRKNYAYPKENVLM